MSDDPVSTIVLTKEGDELGFQDYFVAQQCQPEVKGFRFMGRKRRSLPRACWRPFGGQIWSSFAPQIHGSALALF